MSGEEAYPWVCPCGRLNKKNANQCALCWGHWSKGTKHDVTPKVKTYGDAARWNSSWDGWEQNWESWEQDWDDSESVGRSSNSPRGRQIQQIEYSPRSRPKGKGKTKGKGKEKMKSEATASPFGAGKGGPEETEDATTDNIVDVEEQKLRDQLQGVLNACAGSLGIQVAAAEQQVQEVAPLSTKAVLSSLPSQSSSISRVMSQENHVPNAALRENDNIDELSIVQIGSVTPYAFKNSPIEMQQAFQMHGMPGDHAHHMEGVDERHEEYDEGSESPSPGDSS
ncbi:unnamed protein product, partial [Cladocopium goreaui]